MTTTTKSTTAAPKAPARPIEQAYAAYTAKKAAYIARRRTTRIPRVHADGTVVEVVGRAKVDHVEGGQRTHTDHQGSVGVVVASYESAERGERMASVKCEDGQMRAIPESRLRRIGAVAGEGLPASAAPSAPARSGRVSVGGGDEAYRRNWERLFGKKSV